MLKEKKQMLQESTIQSTNRPRPSRKKKFLAHSWKLQAIRDEPNRAFDLFDANCDGVISVAELTFTARATSAETRLKGSIYNEMKLFALLDLDGDAVISRSEFCEAVRDKNHIPDEALLSICALCELRKAEIKRLSTKKNKENLILDLVATAPWSSSSSSQKNEKNRKTNAAASRTSVRSADCVISALTEDGTRVQLAKTKARGDSLWSPMISGDDIDRLGDRPNLKIELFNEEDNICATETFAVGGRDQDEDPFLGPLPLLLSPVTADSQEIASISGTQRWVPHDATGEEYNASLESPESFRLSTDNVRPRRTPRKASPKRIVYDSPQKSTDPISCVTEFFSAESLFGQWASSTSTVLCSGGNDDGSGCILFNGGEHDSSAIRK